MWKKFTDKNQWNLLRLGGPVKRRPTRALFPRFAGSDLRVSIGKSGATALRDVLRLVAVRIRLVGAANRHVDVLGLLLRERGELRAERREVEPGDLLVELLRKEVDLVSRVLTGVALLPELELREGLVRERAGH